MGQINSHRKLPKLTQEEIQSYEKDTFFTSHEILMLHHAYRGHCNDDGCVDRESFTQIFSNFNKSAKALLFLDHIFRTWDVDRDGNLTFREFLMAMSVTSRGSKQQRSRYLFSLYDIDGNGEITIEEFMKVLKLRLRKFELEKLEGVFRNIDLDGNGALTMDEFVKACDKNPTLMEYLDIY